MRVLIYLLMILTATALSLGVGLVVGFELQDASRWLLVATAATTPFIVLGPAVIGAFAGYWDHRSSPESRRYLGWWFAAVIAVEVVAAVFIVLATLSARAPLWVPVVLVLGAAVLLAVARPLGALFRRTERPIPEDLGPSVPDGSVVPQILPLVLQFQLGFTGLLYVAIVFQCLSYVVRGDLGLLPEVFLAAIVVVLALVFPLTLRRIRRARRYVDQHVHAGDRGSGPDASAV
ncbi:hypothetical protein FHW23_001379 [Curtobacterium pusillum]|uniref:Uncharacterized protein n=1 Tax=Curtobacterium pusillum TaxID=69373 RepID=A0AAW3T578_9MICO|nr:hypothetical protein [Curtobacterium pusillum]MBA8990133.1 hypothetical protein [Curtobacterium pusillum]